MDNRTRTLREVVSIDGWIGEFDEQDTATVHVDAVFLEGTFGEDPSAKVRFKLTLKRAVIVLCIPHEEPLQVIKSTIRRMKNDGAARKTIQSEQSGEAEISGNIGMGLSGSPTANAQAEASAKVAMKTTETREMEVREYLEQHFRTSNGQPAWEFRRYDNRPLRGSPLYAPNEPVASVRRSQMKNKDGGRPVIKIEVRCRREDLFVTDLVIKDEKIWEKFLSRGNRDIKIAAAEQIIKDELSAAGFLEIPDMSESHSEVLVADVIITEDY